MCYCSRVCISAHNRKRNQAPARHLAHVLPNMPAAYLKWIAARSNCQPPSTSSGIMPDTTLRRTNPLLLKKQAVLQRHGAV